MRFSGFHCVFSLALGLLAGRCSAQMAMAESAAVAQAQEKSASPGSAAPDADQLFSAALGAQEKGDYAAAVRDYRALLALRPGSVPALVNLGVVLVKMGRIEDAIPEYEAALAVAPGNANIRLNLALAYYKTADYRRARANLATLHDLQPQDPRVATLLGDCELRLDDAPAAVALLLPFDPDPPQLAGQVTRSAGKPAQLPAPAAATPGATAAPDPDLEYVLGLALIQAGKKIQGAERLYRVGVATHNAEACRIAGSTLLDSDDPDLLKTARQALDDALAWGQNQPRLVTLAGIARDKSGDVPAAEAAFRLALKTDPEDFEANLYLGTILLKRRATEEARPYLDKAMALNPGSTLARYETAILQSNTGLYAQAAANLEQVVRETPQWLDPHVQLASLYYKLHRPEDGARERQIVDRITAEQQAHGPDKR